MFGSSYFCREEEGEKKEDPLEKKLRYSNERSTKFESLTQMEVFRGGKWQNGSSSSITQIRELV